MGGGFVFTNICFGANMKDGEYYIVPVSKSEYSETWEPCWGTNVYRIKATISGNTLTLSEPVQKLSGVITASENPTAGKAVHLSASITNLGSYYNNNLYLVDGNWYSKVRCSLEAEEGATNTIDIDYTPTTSGKQNLYLVYVDGNNLVPFASVNFFVVEDNANLSYSVTVENAVDGCLTVDNANVTVKITNYNSVAYDNKVRLGIYKYDGSDAKYHLVDNFKTQHLTLTSSKTTTLCFDFSNLEDGQKYLLSFNYQRSGEWIDKYGYVIVSTEFVDDSPFAITTNDDVDGIDAAPMNDAKDNDDTYDMLGRKVTNTNHLRGIVIKNGRKILFK